MARKGTNSKDIANLAVMQRLETKRGDKQRIAAALSKLQSRSRGAIPGVIGTGFERSTGAGSSGAGIISPVAEANAGTRTFHPTPRLIQSTDGVFEIEIRDLQSIDMADAADNPVQFVFAQPS